MDDQNKDNAFTNLLSDVLEKTLKRVADSYIIPRVAEMTKDSDSEYYTASDLKEKFGFSSPLQQKYRDKKYITYVQIGRKILYEKESVHQFLNEHKIKSKNT